MSEYELLDLIGTWKADTATNATTLISVLFAYILAAHVAGSAMSRLQVGIVSTLMAWTASINVYQITINQVAIIEYHELIRPEWGANAVARGELVIWIIGLGMVAAIVAALSYMWSVRHPKTE